MTEKKPTTPVVKSSKDPSLTSLKRVRDVITSPLDIFDRIWAEQGFVKMCEKGGAIKSLSPKKAKERIVQLKSMVANAISNGLSPDHPSLKKANALIDKATIACVDAFHQHEDSSVDTVTRTVTRMMQGKKSTGEKYTLENTSEKGNIAYYLQRFPTLDESEIAAVLRAKDPMVFFRRLFRGVPDDMIMQRLQMHPAAWRDMDKLKEKIMELMHRNNLEEVAKETAAQADLNRPFVV